MADFNYSMKNNEFMDDFKDKILSGDGKDHKDPCVDLLLI